jgi:hypothetical protein
VVGPLESGLRVAPGCPSYQLSGTLPFLLWFSCGVLFRCCVGVWCGCSRVLRPHAGGLCPVLGWSVCVPLRDTNANTRQGCGGHQVPSIAGLVSSLLVILSEPTLNSKIVLSYFLRYFRIVLRLCVCPLLGYLCQDRVVGDTRSLLCRPCFSFQ